MKSVTKYILNQVAANQLSHEEAKTMLLELQSIETSQLESVGDTSIEVAIIGMAGKFPKADNIDEYWQNLLQGSNCIDHFPENRQNDYRDQCVQSAFARILTGFTPEEDAYYLQGGFLNEVDKFDAAFFRISPKEAIFMDPLQRVFLETSYEAMEDAGYGGKKLQGAKVGVFAGKDHTDPTMYRYLTETDPMHLTGSWTGILASRISFIFNLRGPSMVIDTACSSGLVAIHEACRALYHGECDLAIAGGIHLQLFPTKKGLNLGMEMVESANGLVRTFDKEANGTVWGEGAGVVILKPLVQAIADRDQIHAVIKGSAINNDGASIGITAPNADAQKEVILRAWKEARIEPETLSYIEAHGTGTSLGDPIEIKGLASAFHDHTDKKQFCGIGSVKTNVGHLVAASGVASVIKVVLALKNHLIPPTIHFETPNPYINFCDSPIYVNDRLHHWEPTGDSPRRAGVNAFGFSGTNCHLVLEEAPQPVESEIKPFISQPGIFTLSARSQNGLQQLIQKYHDFCLKAAKPELINVCYTANTGRGHYQFRLALVVASWDDLLQKIDNLRYLDPDQVREPGIYFRFHKIAPDQKVVRGENDLTENEKSLLTARAEQTLQTFLAAQDRMAHPELFATLCGLYVQGADVDWEQLYRGQKVKRISLPTYPLERIKCWARPNNTVIDRLTFQQKPLHPLVQELRIKSFEGEIYGALLNTKTHWVLNEYRIMDYYIIPGTTYLEMAWAASEEYFQTGPVELQDFLIATPLVVNPGENKEVQIMIKPQSGYLDFYVASKMGSDSENGTWNIHAQGKVYQVQTETADLGPSGGARIHRRYDPEELKKRLNADRRRTETLTGGTSNHENGFALGPRWDNIILAVTTPEEAFLQLKLPDQFQADLNDYYLHPALLDQALNAFSHEIRTGLHLPFHFKKITVYDRLPLRFYSYLRRKDPSIADPELILLDVSLFDESGRVLAEVCDYSIKKVRRAELQFKELTGADVIISPQEDFPLQISHSLVVEIQDWREKTAESATPLQERKSQKSAIIGLNAENEEETAYTLAQIWARVLRLEEIDVNESFYNLGGDSILAIELLNEINREYPDIISVSDIFTYASVMELARYIDQKGGLQKAGKSGLKIPENRFIQPAPVQEYYPVSSAQKRMLVLNQLEEANLGYNLPVVLLAEGDLEWERVEEAFRRLVRRQESMRTSFETVGGEQVQRIQSAMEFQVEYWDIAGATGRMPVWGDVSFQEGASLQEGAVLQEEASIQKIIKDFIRPFDLSKLPLFRVGLIKVGERKHILMIDMHHIISDGTSYGILISEFVDLYQDHEPPELQIQYKDFSMWQNESFQSARIKKQEEYWLQVFSGVGAPGGGGELPLLNLPTDFPRPAAQSFEGNQVDFEAGPELIGRVNQIAVNTGTTKFMVLLAAYNILLFKYTGQEDIIIGSPVAGRSQAGLGRIIGIFINTLALRNYPSGKKSFQEFLAEVKENSLKAFDNQDYQFEALLGKLNLARDLSRNPLFDVMFNLQSVVAATQEIPGLRFSPYAVELRTSKLDLSLQGFEDGERIFFNLEYCTRLFTKETVTRLVRHFVKILEVVTASPEVQLGALDILTEEEKDQILKEFNDTMVEYPQNKTIHQLFEEQVEREPDQTALIFETTQFTYRELNQRANQLAFVLRAKGVKPNQIIGIMTERSLEMIIGILGILKAGAAYLPINPDYPEERVHYLLKDSNTKILLTQWRLLPKLKCRSRQFQGEFIDLDSEILSVGENSNLKIVNTAKDVAYALFTSGSTGKPKGVMIEHRAVLNFIKGMTNRIEFKTGRTILCLTTCSFDIFLLETLLPLVNGLKIVIASEYQQKNPSAINTLIVENQVEILQTTPSRFQLLLNDLDCIHYGLPQLQEIIIGGEAFPDHLLARLTTLTKAKVYNVYGPTETTVWSTLKELTTGEMVNIGKPIANTQILIVNQNDQLQPVGVVGELYIAGAGLARGYLNQPELTAEKFVLNRLIGVGEEVPEGPSLQIYRTGDLARWLPDGDIEILGRNDHQVKIRGFRIELGEIEAYLYKYKAVKEAVVIPRKDKGGGSFLCAYVVLDNQAVSPYAAETCPLNVLELREYLAGVLPDYMIPAHFIQLPQLPLTPNGKVDRKALTDPSKWLESDGNMNSGVEYLAPTKELADVWQEVLGVSPIGIKDNFFNLGGDSIKAIQVISQLRRHKIKLPDILRHPTIIELSKFINSANNMSAEKPGTYEGKEFLEVVDKRLQLEYFYMKDGSFNQFVAILECHQALMYFTIKNKIEVVEPYELFLRDICFHIFQDSTGLITDIDFLDQSFNEGLFGISNYSGKGTEALSQIEALLDQGELVIIQTFSERLPFLDCFQGFDAPEEVMIPGHMFLAVWHDQNHLYYVDSPWDMDHKNFIPYEPNHSIGIISKDQLEPAFSVFVNYAVIQIEEAALPDTQATIQLIKDVITCSWPTYLKKAEKRDGLLISYGREALRALVEMCGKESLSFNQESIPGKMNLYRLMTWKFLQITHRRKILSRTLHKFEAQYNQFYIQDVLKGLDITIKAWENTIYFIEDQYDKKRYLLDRDLQKYFIKIANLEEELYELLRKMMP